MPVYILEIGYALFIQGAVIGETVANRMECMIADTRENLFDLVIGFFDRSLCSLQQPTFYLTNRYPSEAARRPGARLYGLSY